MSPSAVGEVVQSQGARGNAVVKPLPFFNFSRTDPTIEVGSIIEMDGVPKDPEEPWVSDGELLQARVCPAELLLREGTGRIMPQHTSHIAIGRGVRW